MPISGSALILGGVGQWNLKSGAIDVSLSVSDTTEGPSFSLALADSVSDSGKDEDGGEKLSPYLSISLDYAEFQCLAECFASASAAMQAVAAKRPANDG